MNYKPICRFVVNANLVVLFCGFPITQYDYKFNDEWINLQEQFSLHWRDIACVPSTDFISTQDCKGTIPNSRNAQISVCNPSDNGGELEGVALKRRGPSLGDVLLSIPNTTVGDFTSQTSSLTGNSTFGKQNRISEEESNTTSREEGKMRSRISDTACGGDSCTQKRISNESSSSSKDGDEKKNHDLCNVIGSTISPRTDKDCGFSSSVENNNVGAKRDHAEVLEENMAEDITTAPNLKKKKTMVRFTFVLGYVFEYRDTNTMTFNHR